MRLIVCLLALACWLRAGDLPEKPQTGSPNGAFKVEVVQSDRHTQRMEIRDARGKLLFTSPANLGVIEFYPDHLRWSPDSKVLAVSAGYSKLYLTYLFAWNGETFESIPMPEIAEHHDNIGLTPLKWTDARTLKLGFSGPHAGKAKGYGYHGTASVEVDLAKKTAKKLNEQIHYSEPQADEPE